MNIKSTNSSRLHYKLYYEVLIDSYILDSVLNSIQYSIYNSIRVEGKDLILRICKEYEF